MDARQESFKVFMLPWLAHGHISPYLELAKRLAKRKFIVYFCSTPVNLEAIKSNYLSKSYSDSIQLVKILLQSTPELPPHYHTAKGLPPHLMPKLKDAFQMAAPNLESILKTLNPDLLIVDILQLWMLPISSSLNIPMIFFPIFGAITISFLIRIVSNDVRFPEFELRDYWQSKCPYLQMDETSRQTFKQNLDQSSGIILFKSSREIETKYLEFLASSFTNKIVTTGPLLQEPACSENEKHYEIIEWLDKKELYSTVLVSFGSEYYLSKEEIEEIAHGLEISEANFIWIVRFPNGDETAVEAVVPEGFIERSRERGKIVKGWAPQAEILAHRSTGGHMSHCGWSSFMESLMYGVPVIGAPMQLDGPIVARLAEEIGVGLEIKRDEEGRMMRDEIAGAIKKVLMEKSGEVFRKKAKEISSVLKEKDDEELDRLTTELVRLCETKRT